MLIMESVGFVYNKKRPVWILKNLSMEFSKGHFYMITGSSGSGKTTCLNVMGGLDFPAEGRIIIDGRDIRDIGYDKVRRGKVSYVFQDYHLFNHMNAIDNVAAAMQIAEPGLGYRSACDRAVSVLNDMNIEKDDQRRKVIKLSGGQQQRVAIARAVAVNSDYILADEPTGNLDPENAEIIITLLRKLVNEKDLCVIMVTHAVQYMKYSDEVLELAGGQLRRRDDK